MDGKDWNILELIQGNAKIKTKEISEKIHLSASPILKRIDKMEKSGVFKRTIELNNEMLGLQHSCYIVAKLTSNKSDHLHKFKEVILGINEIIDCSLVSGGYDFMIKALVRNAEEFNKFYQDCLSSIGNLATLSWLVIVDEIKKGSSVSLGDFLKKVP